MTTTPYSVSRNLGSSSFTSGYLRTPIIGPLTTNNYPKSLPYHSRGILSGLHSNPPQFFPGQEPINFSQNVTSRKQFTNNTYRSSILNKSKPMDSSMHLLNLKAKSIGSVGKNNNSSYVYTTKNYDQNSVKSALNRTRNQGCTAPKKFNFCK